MDWIDTSLDWQGAGWYRMVEPAGTRLPEEPPISHHCNTGTPGWLNGSHPNTIGETIDSRVCFGEPSYPLYPCPMETQITIKHCNDYFLYHLEETPICDLRYCSIFTNIPTYPETSQNFQELLTECIEKNPFIDLDDLMKKLKESVDLEDNIDVYVSETLTSHHYANILEEKLVNNFNPQHGYCQTFNQNKITSTDIDGSLGNLVFNITGHELIMFFHEENKLPESGISMREREIYRISLTKRIIHQTNLERSPCSEDHFLTCQNMVLHMYLSDIYGCKAAIMDSGVHLDHVFNDTLPDCSASELLEVNN